MTMRNLIAIIILVVTIIVNSFSQAPEIISKERAIQIIDSLKKNDGQAFEHTVATLEYFTNSDEERNNFFKCLNTVSKGRRFPVPNTDAEGLLLADGELPWIIYRIDNGVPSWEEDKSTSLGEKIWIYYYLPEYDNGTPTEVHIGFICSPEMCSTN